MNPRQIRKFGIPEDCVGLAITTVQKLRADKLRKTEIRRNLEALAKDPEPYREDSSWGELAAAVIEERDFVRPEPVPYQTWGEDGIDRAARLQMDKACGVPVAVRGSLMADAHVGYGLPIGGVLACENAVIPYAVGVDIGCRMKLSILELPAERLQSDRSKLGEALETQTRFGAGAAHEYPRDHSVMDADWNITKVTRVQKDRAWQQLGTSGSGNHFVEFGLVTIDEPAAGENPIVPAGTYLGLMSHSGSRGPGAAVCSTYSSIARSRLPRRYDDLAYLAWLDLDDEEGQAYWAAMQLMGQFAAANHDVIHDSICEHIGTRALCVVENFHNFAWIENHDGKDLVVHRKGATPAAEGQLGVIPGSMADPAFLVRGKGHGDSLTSASHGAGRKMSRRAAKEKYKINAVRGDLSRRGVDVISAGSDEVPGAYKNIREVMERQSDLVDTIGRFDPAIVKMCGDGSKAED